MFHQNALGIAGYGHEHPGKADLMVFKTHYRHDAEATTQKPRPSFVMQISGAEDGQSHQWPGGRPQLPGYRGHGVPDPTVSKRFLVHGA